MLKAQKAILKIGFNKSNILFMNIILQYKKVKQYITFSFTQISNSEKCWMLKSHLCQPTIMLLVVLENEFSICFC